MNEKRWNLIVHRIPWRVKNRLNKVLRIFGPRAANKFYGMINRVEIAVRNKVYALRGMHVENVVTAGGHPERCFGDLHDEGWLDKNYQAAAGWTPDYDAGVNIIWTVLKPLAINGIAYLKDDTITWEK